MNKLFAQKRMLICTFSALASGLFGLYVGGQISAIARSQQCQNQAWLFRDACKTLTTPGAFWQGSTTGLWVGTILGAFIGGTFTRRLAKAEENLILSLDDRETLRRLLLLIVAKVSIAELQPAVKDAELLSLLATANQPELTAKEVQQLLLKLGFSQQTILQAEQELDSTVEEDPLK